jgi:hypothetical protein
VKVHELKCWPVEFSAVRSGVKDFEIRRDDRGFARGDIVVLREYVPANAGQPRAAGYTGDSLGPFAIGYVERSACVPEGWCGFRLLRMEIV